MCFSLLTSWIMLPSPTINKRKHEPHYIDGAPIYICLIGRQKQYTVSLFICFRAHCCVFTCKHPLFFCAPCVRVALKICIMTSYAHNAIHGLVSHVSGEYPS